MRALDKADATCVKTLTQWCWLVIPVLVASQNKVEVMGRALTSIYGLRVYLGDSSVPASRCGLRAVDSVRFSCIVLDPSGSYDPSPLSSEDYPVFGCGSRPGEVFLMTVV